jgi:hypothetical protein
MGTRGVLTTVVAGVFALAPAGCGSAGSRTSAAEPRDHGRPVEASVIPASGDTHTVFRVRFRARNPVGVRGHVIRGYEARLRNRRSASSCILDTGGFLNRHRRRSEIVLDPAKMMGLHWCRGSFTGVLVYYRAYACPRHGTCRPPAGFRERSTHVARLRFAVR